MILLLQKSLHPPWGFLALVLQIRKLMSCFWWPPPLFYFLQLAASSTFSLSKTWKTIWIWLLFIIFAQSLVSFLHVNNESVNSEIIFNYCFSLIHIIFSFWNSCNNIASPASGFSASQLFAWIANSPSSRRMSHSYFLFFPPTYLFGFIRSQLRHVGSSSRPVGSIAAARGLSSCFSLAPGYMGFCSRGRWA